MNKIKEVIDVISFVLFSIVFALKAERLVFTGILFNTTNVRGILYFRIISFVVVVVLMLASYYLNKYKFYKNSTFVQTLLFLAICYFFSRIIMDPTDFIHNDIIKGPLLIYSYSICFLYIINAFIYFILSIFKNKNVGDKG